MALSVIGGPLHHGRLFPSWPAFRHGRLSVMAGRVPATRALAVVQPPRCSHRPGVGGRDTPGHDDPGGNRSPTTAYPDATATPGHRDMAPPVRQRLRCLA